MKEETTYHIPVLLMPSVDGMNIRPDGTYVDMTFGGGGHSREILSRLGEGGRLLGFDQDEDAEQNIVNDPHFTFVRSNFRYLHNFLRYHGIEQVDAILADLGVSSHHFDDSERGFSFRFDGMLDMRMNKRAGCTAAASGETACHYAQCSDCCCDLCHLFHNRYSISGHHGVPSPVRCEPCFAFFILVPMNNVIIPSLCKVCYRSNVKSGLNVNSSACAFVNSGNITQFRCFSDC